MKKSSLLFGYFKSYFLIGMIPVIILSAFYYYVNVIKMYSEVENQNFALLNQVISKMDFTIGEMDNVALHMSNSNDLMAVINESESLPINDDIISQSLKLYEESISIPAQLMLYKRSDIYVYLSDGKYKYSTFEQNLDNTADLTMSKFFSDINYVTNSKTKKLESNITDKSSNSSLTCFIYQIPKLNTRPTVSIVFFFDSKNLDAMFKAYFGDTKTNIYIYNKNLQNIFNTEKFILNEDVSKEFVRMNSIGVKEKEIDNNQYIIMRNISNNSGFSYVMVTQKKNFYSSILYKQRMLFIIVLSLIFASIIIAVLMSKHNYKPVRNLLDIVDDEKSKTNLLDLNEFDIIKSKWEDITIDNDSLYKLIDKQREFVFNACLINLISKKAPSADYMEFYLEGVGIDFSKPYLFVMLVTFDEKKIFNEDNIITINNLINEFKNQEIKLYGVELVMENMVAVIVNSDIKIDNEHDIRYTIANNIKQLILEVLNINVMLSASSIHENIKDINMLFTEAMVVVTEYLPYSDTDIILADIIVQKQNLTNTSINYPVFEQALFIHGIKNADKQVALDALDKMIAILKQHKKSLVITKFLCFDIINILIRTTNQYDIKISMHDLNEISNFSNIDEFKEHIIYITTLVCEKHKKLREENSSKLKEDIIKYVNKNFLDQDFSLRSIADKFQLSPSYFSKIFKHIIGCNFIQYITIRRIDYIKEQLRNTEYLISDIIKSAGYYDVASFNKKYKQYEGMTPGQYRKQMKRLNNQ